MQGFAVYTPVVPQGPCRWCGARPATVSIRRVEFASFVAGQGSVSTRSYLWCEVCADKHRGEYPALSTHAMRRLRRFAGLPGVIRRRKRTMKPTAAQIVAFFRRLADVETSGEE